MEKFSSIKISEATDQTILSSLGLGSQGHDLSIGTVSYREPNATSTAVNYVKQREDFLQSCSEKENDYFNCPENFFPEPCSLKEKLVLKAATQSSNIPDEFIDLKEVTLALNKESSLTSENNNAEETTNNYSSGSSLLPGSSILSESKLLSFSECDEVDLKKDTSKFLGLPSYLLGGQSITENDSQITREDGDREEVSKPWGNESSFGFKVDRLQIENITPVWEVPYKEKRNSEVDLPFASAVNEKCLNPFDDEEMKQQDEFNSLEFHELDMKELSLDEENALKRDSFYIGNSFAYASSKAEFSGVGNLEDISLKSSLWNSGNDDTNSKGKMNIEDIFKAKSTKPNFGYDIDDKESYYFEKELEKPVEMPLSSVATANTFASRVSSDSVPTVNFDEQKKLSNLNTDSQSEPKMLSNLMNFEQDKSINLEIIREMLMKMSRSDDLQDLWKKLSQSHRDNTLTKESFLSERTAECLDIKKYRERLSSIIFKDDPQPQASFSHLGNVMNSVTAKNTDNSTFNMMDETSKSTFNKMDKFTKNIPDLCKQTNLGEIGLGNSYQLPASSGWPTCDQKSSNEKFNENDLNKKSIFIDSEQDNVIQDNVVSKTALTGIKTAIEYQIKNPTSELLGLSLKQLDVSVTCNNDEKVDFGLVPECCTVRRNILILNKSKHSIPIFVSLKPICESNEILTWIENYPGMKIVSPSLAACEIEAESAITLLAQFTAPSVDILQNVLGTVQNSGFFEMESAVEVTLDSPFNSTLVLSEIPVKIRIGEVQLRTQRSVLPLKVESVNGQMGSCTCTLRNKSLFPLDLSVKLSDHEQFLSIHPERLSIPSQGDNTIEIRFSPTRNFPKLNIEVKLLILVEPEGMQMDLPLVASLIQKPKPEDKFPALPLLIVQNFSTENQVSNTHPVNLLTNGHHCMFGAVPIGESKSYKFIIQNGWSDDALVMQICIQKNSAFYFSEHDDGSRVLAKEVKLEPKEKLNLIINFAPTKREFYLGSLMCMYKNTGGKTTFPLYGFGGSGELVLKNGEVALSQSEEISFGNLTPNIPSVIKLTGTNTGSRYIFVKLAILPDENSDLPFPPFDICVQPSLLILGPGESKEIMIICMNSTSIMERTLEKFGILKVIYGDEILRRRFRSHNNTKLKRKKINNVRLLMVNFHEEILQENCALKDEESDEKCPLLSDDPVIFYNSCKILSIVLCRDIPENDTSTTMINAGVDATTMKSFMIKDLEKFLANDKGKEVSNPNQRLSKQVMFNPIDFDVVPPSLMIKTSQNDPVEVSVLNRTNKDQVLEVSCEDSYLSVSPAESTVAPNSFTIFKVILNTANLQRNLPKVTKTSIHILGPNYQRSIVVTIEIDSNLNNNEKFLQPSKIPVFSQKQQENKLGSLLPLQNVKAQEKNIQSSSKSGISQSEQRKVELNEREVHFEVPDELRFPNTKFLGESAVKLSLSNYSPDPQQVKVYVLGKHFSIRHQNLTVNGKCMVTIPVYFSPTIKGEIIDIVRVHVASNKKPYLVRLSGKCI